MALLIKYKNEKTTLKDVLTVEWRLLGKRITRVPSRRRRHHRQLEKVRNLEKG